MRRIGKLLAGVVVTGALVAGCAAAATPAAAPTPTSASAATPAASPTTASAPAKTPVLTPTPVPSTDGRGAEYVTGTDSHTGTGGTEKQVGDVTQTRGIVITAHFDMNDPRVSGTGTGLINVDQYGQVGPEWGTTRLEVGGGAWEGTVTGMSWADGQESDLSGWLVGSGAYKGYTYYWHLRATGTTGKVDGIIYPGPPPAP